MCLLTAELSTVGGFFNHVIPTEQKTYRPMRREVDCLRQTGMNADHELVGVGEQMPGARFEPDTPQLHVLSVKKETKPVKTAHTSHTSWIISGYLFHGQIISAVLWPPSSPYLSLPDFVGTFKEHCVFRSPSYNVRNTDQYSAYFRRRIK